MKSLIWLLVYQLYFYTQSQAQKTKNADNLIGQDASHHAWCFHGDSNGKGGVLPTNCIGHLVPAEVEIRGVGLDHRCGAIKWANFLIIANIWTEKQVQIFKDECLFHFLLLLFTVVGTSTESKTYFYLTKLFRVKKTKKQTTLSYSVLQSTFVLHSPLFYVKKKRKCIQ